jgi:hypothetical protein
MASLGCRLTLNTVLEPTAGAGSTSPPLSRLRIHVYTFLVLHLVERASVLDPIASLVFRLQRLDMPTEAGVRQLSPPKYEKDMPLARFTATYAFYLKRAGIDPSSVESIDDFWMLLPDSERLKLEGHFNEKHLSLDTVTFADIKPIVDEVDKHATLHALRNDLLSRTISPGSASDYSLVVEKGMKDLKGSLYEIDGTSMRDAIEEACYESLRASSVLQLSPTGGQWLNDWSGYLKAVVTVDQNLVRSGKARLEPRDAQRRARAKGREEPREGRVRKRIDKRRRFNDKHPHRRRDSDRGGRDKSQVVCFKCKKRGHYSPECPDNADVEPMDTDEPHNKRDHHGKGGFGKRRGHDHSRGKGVPTN